MFSSRLYKYRFYHISQIICEFKEFINFGFYFYLYIYKFFQAKYLLYIQKNLQSNRRYSIIFNMFVQNYTQKIVKIVKSIL